MIEGPWTNAFSGSHFLVTLDLSSNRITGRIPTLIGGINALRILNLKSNRFDGEIPAQICGLYQLSLIVLADNNLSGSIPSCLQLDQSDSLAPDVPPVPNPLNPYYLPVRPMYFTTKRRSYSYQGKILSYISGIDFSCNKLTGEIPPEMGNHSAIYSLNLSYNRFTGPIPSTFSNLKQIESLDLSYNNLNGDIPSQLLELKFLSYFSVAHNNLFGKTPKRTGQFATFEVSSYEGNPNLCGLPLPKSCTEREASSAPRASAMDEESNFLDMNTFYGSFIVSYTFVIIGMFLVLYINPQWRRAWFDFVDICISSF